MDSPYRTGQSNGNKGTLIVHSQQRVRSMNLHVECNYETYANFTPSTNTYRLWSIFFFVVSSLLQQPERQVVKVSHCLTSCPLTLVVTGVIMVVNPRTYFISIFLDPPYLTSILRIPVPASKATVFIIFLSFERSHFPFNFSRPVSNLRPSCIYEPIGNQAALCFTRTLIIVS